MNINNVRTGFSSEGITWSALPNLLVLHRLRFIHQGRPLSFEPLAHAMERLDILLVDVLDRTQSAWSACVTASAMAHSLASRLSFLFGLTYGLTNWEFYELHCVLTSRNSVSPDIVAATDFYTDAYRGQLYD